MAQDSVQWRDNTQIQQDTPRTYNVTSRSFRLTIVAV